MCIKGQCLCGKVEFQLRGKLPHLYQCHCSLCRKVTGSSANAALIVDSDQFAWVGGEEQVKEFATDSGFKSHFCTNCGSPLPNLTASDTAWWIPVGLLDDSDALQLAAHLYVGSKAAWDVVAQRGQHFEEMPGREELRQLLDAQKS